MIDEDFRTLLAAQVTAGTPIEKGLISAERYPLRIYYQRANAEQDLDLRGAQGLNETTFDVECGAISDDATVQTLAANIKTALNGYPFNGVTGNFGASSALGIFVADHSDDYQPRGVDADDGYHVATFQVKVIHL